MIDSIIQWIQSAVAFGTVIMFAVVFMSSFLIILDFQTIANCNICSIKCNILSGYRRYSETGNEHKNLPGIIRADCNNFY